MFPIGKIMLDTDDQADQNKQINRFVMYDATSDDFITIASKNLNKAISDGYNIRGFLGGTNKLNSFFSKLRSFDNIERLHDSNKEVHEQYLVYSKEVKNMQTMFNIIQESGKRQQVSRKEFYNMLRDGVVILGTKPVINKKGEKTWAVTSDIIVKVNNSVEDYNTAGT